jgi:hypothetical protein
MGQRAIQGQRQKKRLIISDGFCTLTLTIFRVKVIKYWQFQKCQHINIKRHIYILHLVKQHWKIFNLKKKPTFFKKPIRSYW